MSLTAFLAQNAIKPKNKKVIISNRFIGADGIPIPFEIRAITEEENTSIKNLCINRTTVRGQQSTSFDNIAYTKQLVAASVVSPDLLDAELQKSYGVVGETNLLSAMLLSGEFAELSEKVQEISGFSAEDFTKAKEKVKNS